MKKKYQVTIYPLNYPARGPSIYECNTYLVRDGFLTLGDAVESLADPNEIAVLVFPAGSMSFATIIELEH
jgi:hypothetical protein